MVAAGGAVLVRAEVASSSRLALIVEGVRSPEYLEAVISELERACGAGEDVRRQLSSSDRCELEAHCYQELDQTLQAAGLINGGGPFRWVPLPLWVVAALPGFGGADHAETLPPLWLPEGMMPYQRLGVQRAAVQGGRVLLADEMGLGKTMQALTVMAQYLEEEGPALVVTPSSLGGVWKEQALRWLPQLRASEVQVLRGAQDRPLPQARLVVVSYALFARESKALSRTPRGGPWQIAAVDEAHYLRNPSSQRARVLLPVLQAARRCLLMTGTPAPKQASEAFSLLHALRPLGCSFQEWCARYGSERTEHREAEVAALLSEVMVRRTKADVLDQLPPKRRQRILLQLPAGKAGALKKLQADAQSPASDEAYFGQLARVKEAAAQDYTDYLLDASGGKFLLFAHHISMLDALEKTVARREVGSIRIDGSTPAEERMGRVQRFQSDPSCRVAVLGVLAAGEGLTLTAASLCVFCELCPAVPGVIEQAEARVHRIGQQASGVDVHFLVVDGTRDDRVFARLEERTDVVARTIGDVVETRLPRAPANELDALFEGSSPSKASAQRPQARRPSAAAGGAALEPPKKKRKPSLSLESVLSAGISRLQAQLSESSLGEAEAQAEPFEAHVAELAPASVAPGGRSGARARGSRRAPAESREAAASGKAVGGSAAAVPAAPTAKRRAGSAAKTRLVASEEEATDATPTTGGVAAPVHEEEEDDMDIALSFFTSEARASPAAAASSTEDAGRFAEGRREPAVQESSGCRDREEQLGATSRRPLQGGPDPRAHMAAAAEAPPPAAAPREDPLAALLGGLIDAAREGR